MARAGAKPALRRSWHASFRERARQQRAGPTDVGPRRSALGELQWQPRKKAARKKTARKRAAKRELIDTGTNKLYVRRNTRGTSFKEAEDVGRSLAQDRRRKAKHVAKRGQGDRGDRRR